MRWDEQRVGEESERPLPGLSVDSIRTFDAPEALGIRFHEVRAKSALNHVPGSRFGFNWTINLFRGCTHACAYCMAGDSQILMADGSTRDLSDLRVGDQIYGTVMRGGYRRYIRTVVKAHWSSVKPAYRIRLEDGTELVASPDHRFLTARRGWKYVTGSEQGAHRRPHLTANNELMGTGKFAAPPGDSAEYRRGYLCGLIRGDGHLGTYAYRRATGTTATVHRFRLALTDFEALQRARKYLDDLDIETDEFEFATAAGERRAMTAIRTQRRDGVAMVRELIEWPRLPSEDWCKGFLAGVFDAEGSYSGSLRISNTDRAIIDWTTYCLRRSGFEFVIEDHDRPNRLVCVRVAGGLQENLRFLHMTSPAITRKRSIDGLTLKSKTKLRVRSIEPLGFEMPMYDITTGTGDFIANGIVSHNCFARPTHRYLDLDAGRDFEREIVVKVNLPEVLRVELQRPSWKRELVAIGTNTDPYQWVEGRYQLMPPVLDALHEAQTPVSVLTKSPLALRDIDRYAEMAAAAGASVNLSIPTLDEKAWRATEPHTPHPRARLEAVAELSRRGIESGVLVMPLMPGINDDPAQVDELVRLAREAGAASVATTGLHLRGEVRDVFFGWLAEKRPDLIPRYEELYAGGAYLPKAESRRLNALVKGWGRNRRRYSADRAPRDRTRRQAAQGSLF